MASVITRAWDDFNRANESNIAAEAAWDSTEGQFDISSNHVVPNSFFNDTGIRWVTNTFGPDQYSQVKLSNVTGTNSSAGPGVLLPASGAGGSGTYYRIVLAESGSAHALDIGKVVAGVYSQLFETSVTYANPCTFRAEIRGNTLKVYIDGVLVGSVSDTSSPITTGNPGIFYSSAMFTADIDDWQGGELDRGNALASDYFLRADEFLTGGTHGWIILPGANSGMQILSTQVYGSGDPISASIVSNVTFPDDQWARCIWDGGGSDSGDNIGIGLILRGSAAATTCYTCLLNSTSDVWVGKYVAGTYTPLGNTQLSFSVGDELWFEVVGTKLRVYKNDVQVGTDITDTSIASGAPGAMRKSSSSNHISSFHAGDFLGPKIIGVEQVDASGASGTPSITVPIGTEAILAFWAHFDSTAQSGLATLSLGGNAFTILSEIETKQIASDTTGTGVAKLENIPGIGAQTLSWAWEAGGARDEGGGLFIVFLENVNTGDISRAAATDSESGGGIPTVTMSTISTDKCLALYQAFSAGGQDESDFVRGWENDVTVNSEHYWLLEAGYDFANNEDSIADPGSGDYSTIAAIVLKRFTGVTEPPPAGDAGPTLIRLIGNRQTW